MVEVGESWENFVFKILLIFSRWFFLPLATEALAGLFLSLLDFMILRD